MNDFLRALLPARVRVNQRERLRAALGGALGIALTALLCRAFAPQHGAAAWLIAPMGASAVLIFALPASPLAQPWAVVGSHTVAALAGVACAAWIPDPAWAGAVAVGLAIAAMFALRCLHPPGGATALFAVLSHSGDPRFVLFPVLANALLMALAGMAYNSLTGRRYPHAQQAAPAAPARSPHFTAADFDAALAHYNQVLDVPRDDLEALLQAAELAAWQRQWGELRCAEAMSADPVTVLADTSLADAWAAMRQRRVKALPVVDAGRRIVGIVALADFMRHAQPDAPPLGLGKRLRAVLTGGKGQPKRIEQIMTREVRTARADQRVAELVPLFSEGGHHHIPIVDGDGRLAGILTQSDLVRVLYRAAQPQ
ncbi:MAG: HPP family protein [Acidovorax sp.]